MRKQLSRALLTLCALLLGVNMASASLSNYLVTVERGDQIEQGKSTNLWRGEQDGGKYSGIGVATIPFTFFFDGTGYTRASISLNGVIGLGSSDITESGSNDLTGQNVPLIAPYWDQLRLAGNGANMGFCGDASIDYWTTGSAPNRIFVVHYANFQTVTIQGSPSISTMQVRLYETSNRIEFWYGTMSSCDNCFGWYGECQNTSASIGLAVDSKNFISITPRGSEIDWSTEKANNSVDIYNDQIDGGIVYGFVPCNIDIAGNIDQGGTESMTSGDKLFDGFEVQRGNSEVYQPFTIFNALEGCSGRDFRYSISGPAAADYELSETDGRLEVGESNTPSIRFTPGAPGLRSATLTVTDDNGFSRSFPLVNRGATRIEWIGNLAQGGTANVSTGDTLLKGMIVRRLQSMTYMPITIRNFNENPEAPAAPVRFTITDPTGQFTMDPPSQADLEAGADFTPTIRFSATGVGFQEGTLTVSADGEVRTFRLRAFSAAPGADFIVNNEVLTPSSGVFNNTFNCIGEVANTLPLTIRSIGSEPFIISSIEFLEVDTGYTQGVPRFQLVRDRFGNTVPLSDYFISTQPGVAPLAANRQLTLPDTIPGGVTRTYYITYIGQDLGKRFGRAYIRTNGETFLGTTVEGQSQLGMLNFQLFGRAVGGQLSDNRQKQSLKTMVFSETRVGDSIEMTYQLFNSGDCDLRISYEKLAISSGDVRDFRLLSAFGRPVLEGVPMTGDAILAPDSSGMITVRFTPQRGGSRRATIWLQTNDSAAYVDGVIERGTYYLDLYGYGKTFLDFTDLKLRPAVIGTGVASTGTVRLINSSTTGIDILSIELVEGDAAQFSEYAAGGAWPATPHVLLAGGELLLGVQMLPTGDPGLRTTKLRVTTASGEVVDVIITGEAGSQGLSVSTNNMFTGAVVPIGSEMRQVLMITNTGTLPLRLNAPVISGAGASEYRLGAFPRLILEPNAVEYLEVTYAPTLTSPATAELTISSDAGTQVVTLEGEGSRTKPSEDPSATRPGRGGMSQPEITLNMGSTSSLREGAAAAAGVAFDVVRPNPARERAELVYHLSHGGDVRLELYDATGRLVRELASGTKGAGEHRLTVDVSELSAGVYHCRLATGSVELVRNVVVAR